MNNPQSDANKGTQTVPPDTRIPENIDDPRDRLPIEDDPPINNEDPTVPRYFADRNRGRDSVVPGPGNPPGIDTPTDPDREYPVDEGPVNSPPMGDDDEDMDTDADGFSRNRSRDTESNVPNI